MKIKVYAKALMLTVCFYASIAHGQGPATIGTDFWLGFMENYLGDDTAHTDSMKVYITTDNLSASGTVSVPLGGWSQNFSVPPNSTTIVTIPTSVAMCKLTDSIENKGVHVTSDNPVSVYQLNYVQYTSDANINIPTSALGTKYRVTTYQPSNASLIWTEVSISEILVVAAYDSTVIRIVPKCNTLGGHGANIPFTITLNQGEVYPIKQYVSSGYSLTGTLIEIDTTVANNCKTFAVFSGNLCAFIPGDSCCCNHICEQMMPVNTWGKQYITVPLATLTGDVFRIVGQQDGTIFSINGGAPHAVNAGSYYEADISTPSFIDSNYPISVAQFSKNDGNVNSDPFMIMLSPLDQTINRMVFNSFDVSFISSYYVNILTRTDYTNQVNLDGVNISTSFSTVLGNPHYSFAQVPITQGNHILNSDSGIIANTYGYGWYEAYGYIAGASLYELENSFNIIIDTNSFIYCAFHDSICIDTLITFTAVPNSSITDFYWNFGDGTTVMHGQSVTHTYTTPGEYTLTYYYLTTFCGVDSIVWRIHVRDCIAQSINDLLAGNLDFFRIFPNPIGNYLTIESKQKATIEIYNIEGQILKTINIADKQTSIDVSDLAGGVYIIKAKTEKGVAVRKFVKE